MLNTTSIFTVNQDSNKLPQNFFSNMEGIIRKLPRAVRALLNDLLWRDAKFRINCPSQFNLARHAFMTRIHCNRSLKKLVKLGFIEKIYRHRTTCIYKINEVFKHPVVASRLRHLLPNIAYKMMLTLAFSNTATNQHIEKNVTPIKVKLSHSVYKANLAKRQLITASHSTKRIGVPLGYQNQDGWNDSFKKIIRGEERMSLADIMPEAIREIQSLDLTTAGMIRLMAFPDEAVRWAEATIMKRHKTKIDDPFKYFVNLCLRYCGEHKLAADWSLVSKLNKQYSLSADADPLVTKTINRPKQHQASKQSAHQSKYAKQEREPVFKPKQWEDRDTWFKSGCPMDHTKSITDFQDILARMDTDPELQRRVKNFGGISFVKACLDNNIACQSANHDPEKNYSETRRHKPMHFEVEIDHPHDPKKRAIAEAAKAYYTTGKVVMPEVKPPLQDYEPTFNYEEYEEDYDDMVIDL